MEDRAIRRNRGGSYGSSSYRYRAQQRYHSLSDHMPQACTQMIAYGVLQMSFIHYFVSAFGCQTDNHMPMGHVSARASFKRSSCSVYIPAPPLQCTSVSTCPDYSFVSTSRSSDTIQHAYQELCLTSKRSSCAHCSSTRSCCFCCCF